jgi:hypothetical protein
LHYSHILPAKAFGVLWLIHAGLEAGNTPLMREWQFKKGKVSHKTGFLLLTLVLYATVSF